MRVTERYGWNSPASKDHSSYKTHVTSSVEIYSDVSVILQRQLFSSSRKLGGLLFGYHVGDHLRIVMASTVGIPDWYEGEHRNELKIDQRFILGWSEALYHLYGGRIEWVGNWIVGGENEDCKAQSDVDVLLEWAKTGLFDDRNILLTVRQERDDFVVKTYAVNDDKMGCEVPNMFSRSKIS
ncbi:hypothetical protein [Deinococcus sp.]|uniref:hypothetical protein n=1 Tax=Deinococcus sp. TaxID=47478 RepID=UPI00391C0DBB